MDELSKPSRRAFLRGSAAAAAGTVAGAAVAQTPDPLITELQDWASYTGAGVDETPYGIPIQYESHVVRRNVEWLTASPISSINFTPIHALMAQSRRRAAHLSATTLVRSNYAKKIIGL